MLKILRKINIGNFKKAIEGVFRRTPLAMLISIAIFVLFIVLVRIDDMSLVLDDNLHKAVLTLTVTFFFSVAMYLYSETKNISRVKRERYQLVTLVFGCLFFYFFEENLFTNPQTEIVVYCILALLGTIAFVFIAPFISKLRAGNLSQEEFYIATYNLLIKTLMSMIVGLAVMFLGFVAFMAIFTLFDFDSEFINEGNWYAYWSAFSFALFASTFFLVNLPFVKERKLGEIFKIQANKFYFFLINYVGLPAIFIYFLILYAYTIKVLMHFSDWPQGEIAWLVISFSFFGYLVYLATYAFANAFKPAKILRQSLPMAVLLQTLMLFYAIGLRINQYDITINRYLVVIFGLWLFGLSLYFIISKKKSLSVPFSSLLVIVIFISIGPWSVYLLPERRQQNNLEANLRKANILQDDGKIKPLEKYKDISKKLSGEVYSGIGYLCNYHGCDTLDKYFKVEIDEIKKIDREKFEKDNKEDLERAEKKNNQDEKYIKSIKEREYSEINNWELIRQLTEKIKVEEYYWDDEDDEVPEYFNFINNSRRINASVNVSGYDYFAQMFYEKINKKDMFFKDEQEDLSDTYFVRLDTNTDELKLHLGETIVETFQMEEVVAKSLLEKKNNSLKSARSYMQSIILANEDMTFEFVGVQYNLKLVLDNIDIKNPEWVADDDEKSDDIEMPRAGIHYGSGYVLIKKK